MNLKEIKNKYYEEIENLLTNYIPKIDNFMKEHYIQIKEEKNIVIFEGHLNGGYSFNNNYLPGIIQGLIKHYKKDWKISHNIKKNSFLFELKEEKEEKEKLIKGKINNRSEILDL